MPSLSGMSRLYSVMLPNNRLSKLDGLMNVYMLSLYKNLFTEIPTQTEPDTLVRLDMNYNPVQHMRMITSFSNLTDIRLSNTKISVIPSDIYELERLSFLDLSFSQISHVPNTILKLAKLQYLVVQGNSFSAEEIDSIKMEFSTQRPDVTLLI
jgi:Leucine-rich repeat (LRR) protein